MTFSADNINNIPLGVIFKNFWEYVWRDLLFQRKNANTNFRCASAAMMPLKQVRITAQYKFYGLENNDKITQRKRRHSFFSRVVYSLLEKNILCLESPFLRLDIKIIRYLLSCVILEDFFIILFLFLC